MIGIRHGVFLLALGLCGHAGTAAAERLKEAMQSALQRNPEVRVAAANLRAATEGHAQAAAGRLPTVDLRAGTGREETESVATRSATGNTRTLTRQEANLTLRQNLFDGQQVSSEIERQEYRVASTHARLTETGEQIALRTVEAYLDALRDAELVRLAADNVNHHESVLEKTRLRFSSGVGQRADVEQAGARLALARSTLAGVRGNADDSAARYLRVVGRLPENLLMPGSPGAAIPAALPTAQQQGRDNSHGLKAARAEIGAAQAAVRSVRADLLPRVDVELAANRNRDLDGLVGPNNDLSAMVVMRYNLFRGGADRSRIREARERETAAAESANNIVEFTDESVARSWAARAAALNRIAPLESHVQASERVLDAYRYQFELGRRSLLDLLNAENELFQARAALSSGRITLRASEFRLLAAMGVLVDSQGLSSELARFGDEAQVDQDGRLRRKGTRADESR